MTTSRVASISSVALVAVVVFGLVHGLVPASTLRRRAARRGATSLGRGATCRNQSRVEEHDYSGGAASPDPSANSFDALGVSPPLQRCADLMGWITPTPIQRLAIPAILRQVRDDDDNDDDNDHYHSLWCEAPTGSGKTGGYALPLLQCLLRSNKDRSTDEHNRYQVQSLVLVPTRELAVQIGDVFSSLRAGLPRPMQKNLGDVVVLHGGVPMGPQMDALLLHRRRSRGGGCDVLVATPGRLVDLVRHYQTTHRQRIQEEALERRFLEALDRKNEGRNNHHNRDVTLTLHDLHEADLGDLTMMNEEEEGDSSEENYSDLSNMLNQVRYLVIDEADRLLGHAFQKELDPLLDMLPNARNNKKQHLDNDHDEDDHHHSKNNMKVMLFSATFPEEIQIRVQRVLERLNGRETPPLRLSCSEHDTSVVATPTTSTLTKKKKRHTSTPKSNTSLPTTIALRTVRLQAADRTRALRHLLDTHPHWDRVLVFVSTRYLAGHVARKLRRAGYPDAVELHGKLDQDTRRKRLRKFMDASSPPTPATRKRGPSVLLATDLASRGLDIPRLPAVVNYDLPRSTADFTHRVGRTGRAGRPGEAVTFVTARDEAHYDLIEKRELFHSRRGTTTNVVVPRRETWPGFEVDEATWRVEARAGHQGAPGAVHSEQGLTYDRMHGGIKSVRRKSKKDKLREKQQAALLEEEEGEAMGEVTGTLS